MSDKFIAEWGPAIDKENQGFIKHQCFEEVELPNDSNVMPGLWVLTRKSDNTPKARFCVGGHHQILGKNYL